jgi:hypothetical protein
VIYTATLVTSDAGALAQGDTITFADNNTDINGCGNQSLMSIGSGTYTATCDETGSAMSLGSHSISASFNGDINYTPETGYLTQNVNPGATITTITSPSPGASIAYGNESNISFNVTVSLTSKPCAVDAVGGSNNGNPTGDATVTADGISLLAPGTCSVANGWAETPATSTRLPHCLHPRKCNRVH